MYGVPETEPFIETLSALISNEIKSPGLKMIGVSSKSNVLSPVVQVSPPVSFYQTVLFGIYLATTPLLTNAFVILAFVIGALARNVRALVGAVCGTVY